MTNLSVNVNKVATLRNTRNIGIPNVLEAAKVCVAAGANGITVHPRPDQRHIRPADVYALAEWISVEFNIEGYPAPAFLELIREVRPDQCTLVPDAPEAFTSDHGWDVAARGKVLESIVGELESLGVRVSLFMDADPEQIKRAAAVGPSRVELYTAPYAEAFAKGDCAAELQRYVEAAVVANGLGLGVNAGHDLNLANLGTFAAAVPGLLEVSIGHALISEALFMGLDRTVREYVKTLAAPKRPA
jgi:pyridoxine 5-phosphate synthase